MYKLLTLLTISVLTFYIYDAFLQESNAYYGFVRIYPRFDHVVLATCWALLAVSIMPNRITHPSDLFLVLYSVFCFVWASTLWQATDLLSVLDALALMGFLYMPAFMVLAARRFVLPKMQTTVFPIAILPRRWLLIGFLAILGLGAAAAVSALGLSGDLGIDTVYERRFAGRDALTGNVYASYMINIAINGITPLLAFIAGWRRAPVLFALAMSFVVLLFFLLGLKSPAVNVCVMAGTGFLLSTAAGRTYFSAIVLTVLAVIYGYVALEVSTSGYSGMADYIVRRVSLVQPQVQSYYMDFWFDLPLNERLLGAALPLYSDWTFMIGDLYLTGADINANTNAYLYELIKSGLLGYAIGIVMITAILLILDALYIQTAFPEFIAISGIYGILISEKAYTTALLSSGIFLCVAMTLLFSYEMVRTNQHQTRISE